MEPRKDIGAAWVKKDKNGKTYFTGNIKVEGKDVQFIAFGNSFKEKNPKAPDYRFYENHRQPGDTKKVVTKPAAPAKIEVKEEEVTL